MKRKYYYLVTALSTLLAIIIIYILKGVAPFGENSLLTIDFFHQYAPMLGELYNRILNHDTLVYSFTMGLGVPFFKNFFNYLSSPINILVLFFKHKDLLMSYSIVIGLKVVLSAVTMSFYLDNKFKFNYKFIPVSILYAFNAYFVAYYWNIMWLDGIYMLPLVVFGIEQLIEKDKPLFYIVFLSIMLWINYFIGYMICIFSVIYFIMYLILVTKKINHKLIVHKILEFAISSLLVGGLCAFFLLPLFFSLNSISATGDLWPVNQYYSFTFLEFLFKHFSGPLSTVLSTDVSDAPNLSCGIISVALVIVFLINNKIKLKTKICYISVLLVLLISYYLAPLDYIWHGMHVPNDLPFRYSFIYCFILIVISGYALNNIDKLKKKTSLIIYIICLGMVVIARIINIVDYDNFMLVQNIVIITIAYLLYLLYISKFKKKKILLILFIALSVGESVITVNRNWFVDQKINDFYNDYDNLKELFKVTLKNNQDKFYRIGNVSPKTLNDSSWYNYYGSVSFSSMEYESTANLLFSLGLSGNEINSYSYKNTTPIYDLMFDIKYVLGDTLDNNIYDVYYDNNIFKMYQNKYILGLMYGVNSDISKYVNSYNPFINQNNYIYLTTGISDVLETVDGIQSQIVYTNDDKTIVKYIVKNNYDNLYLYTGNYGIDFILVDDNLYYLNDDYEYIYDYDDLSFENTYDYNERYIINDKSDSEYIDLYIGYSNYADDYNNLLDVYRLNRDIFQQAYNYLNQYKVDITDFKENHITGKINSNKDVVIYSSISYDRGWHVYVDGKRVKTFKLLDALLSFKVTEGEHVIELKYEIPYLKIGIIISVLSLICVIFIIKKNNVN